MDLEPTQINNAVFCKRLVIEANFCFGTRADHRAGLIGDLAAARDKVCVQMGIEYMRQRQTPLRNSVQILIHVAERIDQYPLFCIVRSDQISRITEPLVYKWFDKIRTI